VFPSPYFHIGGDEVQLLCWEEDRDLMAWVSNHNTTLSTLFKEFEIEIFKIVRQLGM
jgi:N-acetyl-beta-hexosaminidase